MIKYCKVCGEMFITDDPIDDWCSDECKEKSMLRKNYRMRSMNHFRNKLQTMAIDKPLMEAKKKAEERAKEGAEDSTKVAEQPKEKGQSVYPTNLWGQNTWVDSESVQKERERIANNSRIKRNMEVFKNEAGELVVLKDPETEKRHKTATFENVDDWKKRNADQLIYCRRLSATFAKSLCGAYRQCTKCPQRPDIKAAQLGTVVTDYDYRSEALPETYQGDDISDISSIIGKTGNDGEGNI